MNGGNYQSITVFQSPDDVPKDDYGSFPEKETKSNENGEGFSAKLWSIDLTGYNERLVETETDASDPSWSSLLSK